MPSENHRPTQEDVAREAGVSRAVVSYVINNRSGGKVRISEPTRRRVLEVVQRLGYQPNVNARSLRTRRSQLIAVMVPDLTNPFYPLMIRGAQAVAQRAAYDILVYDCDDQPARERSFVWAMLGRMVDGVILVAFHLKAEDVSLLTRAGIEVVGVGGELRPLGVDIVVPGEREAVRELMQHLIGRGHRFIAHLAGPPDTPPGRVRLEAYRQALAEAGLAHDESLVRYGAFDREHVAELVGSLFPTPAGDAHPTALFAANDVMAIEAIRTLTRLGWRVPADVAVCGFDNIPEAEVVMPPLTTVDQDAEAIGQRAAELLLERLSADAPLPPREVSIACRLVLRESA